MAIAVGAGLVGFGSFALNSLPVQEFSEGDDARRENGTDGQQQ